MYLCDQYIVLILCVFTQTHINTMKLLKKLWKYNLAIFMQYL